MLRAGVSRLRPVLRALPQRAAHPMPGLAISGASLFSQTALAAASAFPSSTSAVALRSAVHLPVRHLSSAFSSSCSSATSPSPPSPPSSSSLIDALRERGFVQATTSHLDAHFRPGSPPRTIYAGFDPTGDSLHLGNLLVVLALMHFYRAGHQVVALVGGATGLIGDPSGRSTERSLLSPEQVAQNAAGIQRTLQRLVDSVTATATATATAPPLLPPKFVNNNDWYRSMSVVDYLRDVGKHFRMGPMLAKDSVKLRLGTAGSSTAGSGGGEGMSFTEFAYQTLQGYDFYHLHARHGVTVQVGGSDQWGNITAGIDFVQRKLGSSSASTAVAAAAATTATTGFSATSPATDTATGTDAAAAEPVAHGLTLPLLLTSAGVKFGKSAGNAVWLDPAKTSAYALYQYLFQTADADVERLLRLFTFLPLTEVVEIARRHASDPGARLAQRTLAEHVVTLVHGPEPLRKALLASELLFPSKHGASSSPSAVSAEGAVTEASAVTAVTPSLSLAEALRRHGLTIEDLLSVLEGVPRTVLPRHELFPLASVPPSPTTPSSLDQSGERSTAAKTTDKPKALSIAALAVRCKAVASNAEARRLAAGGGLYLNGQRVDNTLTAVAQAAEPLFDRLYLLRCGAKRQFLVVLDGEPK